MAKKPPQKRQQLTDLEMTHGVWKAMTWTGAAPRTMRDLLSPTHTQQLDGKCPIPGGWSNVGVEYGLCSVRNSLWRNTESLLWDALERSLSGTLLICDEGLVSYQGLHVVCSMSNEKFAAWLEWHREGTMILNPARSVHSVVWCSRLVDMVVYADQS